jgi:hypothetical protein
MVSNFWGAVQKAGFFYGFLQESCTTVYELGYHGYYER